MKNSRDLLIGYLGDVLATQNHLSKTLEQQLYDPQVGKQSDALQFLTDLHTTIQRQGRKLEERLHEIGGSVTANVKEAVTAATGFAAGLFGRIRPQVASKFLRDDYVVLSACAIGYEMLHTTALATRDQRTAELTLQNLQEITPLIVRLSELIPGVVISELADDVSGLDPGAILIAKENTRRAWSAETVHQTPG